MSRRLNFTNTMNHCTPEDIILDLGGNPLSSLEGDSMKKLLELLGYSYQKNDDISLFGKVQRIDERLLKYLDIDTRSVGHIIKPQRSQFSMKSNNEYIDEWGIRRTSDGKYWNITNSPLKGATTEDLSSYEWPVAASIDVSELEKISEEAKKLFFETDFIICAEHPVYGIFELGCWLCGFDDFLVKLMIDQDFVLKLFDILLSYQKEVIDMYYGYIGNYIHYTSSGDDFATQRNLFMNPDIFRELIKPYYTERIKQTKNKTNAYYLHHSCGNVQKIIPDLIDAGVDILNPIQPEATDMDPDRLKADFGDKIVFHGGIGTQHSIFFSGDELESYIQKTIDVLGKQGGYIFAAAHNIQEDVPAESVVHLFQAARLYGKRKNSETI
jgi:uroporphyrinogen decarboxylase